MTSFISPGLDPGAIGLGSEAFQKLFPFHIACDPETRVIQAGRSLTRVCPDLQPGVALSGLLDMQRPEGALTFESIRRFSSHLMLLRHRETGLVLRGQWLLLSDDRLAVFVGGPWLTSTGQFAEYGLQFEDFATHDPIVDLLQVVQSHHIGLEDTRRLAEKLKAQRTMLREANAKLTAQNALLQEREQYTRMLGLVASRTINGVIITDADGLILWVNDGFRRITGYSLDEVQGLKPGSILQGPETDPEVVSYIRSRVRAGEGFEVELINYGKTGRKYWIAIEVQPIRDAGGRVTNFMAIEADITERKRSEQRRDLQYRIVRTLAQASSLGEGIVGVLSAVSLALNWRFGAYWQVDPDADALRVAEIWHDGAAPMEEFLKATRKLTLRRGEGLPGRVWQSGEPLWLRDVSTDTNFPRAPFALKSNLHGALGIPCTAGGRLLGVMEFFSSQVEEPDPDLLNLVDVIANEIGFFIVRQQTQAALRTTSALQKAILANAGYAIITTSPDGLIRTFNPAAEKMLGYRSDEIIGQATPEIIHDPAEVRARAAELSQKLGRTVSPGFEAFIANLHPSGIEGREWTYIRKDGSRFPVMLTVTALTDEQEGIQGYIGIASDITERKRAAETLLKAKEEAEGLARVKSEFLANMSHEIRTPMNGVMGMIGLLLETDLTPEQRRFAGTAMSSAESLLTLLGDILDFSKMEAGKLTLDRQEFGLRRLLDDVAAPLALRAQQKGVEFICAAAPDVPDRLRGDPIRLRQILVNLAGNAVKFTDKGEIVVRVETTSGTEAGPRAARGEKGGRPSPPSASLCSLRFTVRDTGIGIPADTRGTLFTKFSQVDTSSTRRFGGTGLGLAIARQLTELMGGRIGVESEEGRGSTFWFVLPLEVSGALEAPDGRAAADLSGARILVVDDNATSRQVLTTQLRAWGFGALEAGDGPSALAALREARKSGASFHAAIIDLQMPGMDGLALAQAIRSEPDYASMRMILLTSMGHATESERFRRAGFSAFLSKPVCLSELLGALVAALRGIDRAAISAPLPAAEPRPDIGRPPHEKAPRVLLVEDNKVNQLVAEGMLKRLGVLTDTVGNGADALAILERERYDVVLMDIQMPLMDGLEATRRIRARESEPESSRPSAGGRRLPVIAMTAHAMQGDREKCLEAGMDDHVTKPLSLKALAEVLARWLPRDTLEQGGGI